MCICSLELCEQQFEVIIGSHRLAEQQTLYVIAIERLEKTQLILGLHALRDNVHLQASAHVDDRADDCRIVRIRGDVTHERLVDFQRADRKLLQSAYFRESTPYYD